MEPAPATESPREPRTIHDILPGGTFYYWVYDPTPWRTLRDMLPCKEYTPPELPFGRQAKTYHILELVDREFYHAIVDNRRHRQSESYFKSVHSFNLRKQNQYFFWETVHFRDMPAKQRNKRARAPTYDPTSSEDDSNEDDSNESEN
jgi:hypothetical protein